MPRHILTLTCPDRPGIVHAVSGALLEVGGNIIENAQFGDVDTGLFCMRTEFDSPTDDPQVIASLIQDRLADEAASIVVRNAEHRPRVLIMVSKYDHCLVDLLYRWRIGDLRVDIPLIVSNHADCAQIAANDGIRYVHLPIAPATKPEQERALLNLIDEHQIDLVVLARYMQVLSDGLCEALSGRAINIHHSFLPGFKGARPYHQACERASSSSGRPLTS
jgi:formyltetrahydrofolate deformylase